MTLEDLRTTRPLPRLTVIGAGYLGTTHAACMAQLGFDVLLLDTDRSKVESLEAGKLPFYEPGLAQLLKDGLKSGHLRITGSYDDVAAHGDVHFLCVGTPQAPQSHA